MIDAIHWTLGLSSAFAVGTWAGFQIASRRPLPWLDDPRAWQPPDAETAEPDDYLDPDKTAVSLRNTVNYRPSPELQQLLDRCRKDRL